MYPWYSTTHSRSKQLGLYRGFLFMFLVVMKGTFYIFDGWMFFYIFLYCCCYCWRCCYCCCCCNFYLRWLAGLRLPFYYNWNLYNFTIWYIRMSSTTVRAMLDLRAKHTKQIKISYGKHCPKHKIVTTLHPQIPIAFTTHHWCDIINATPN